jgi:hypothetical protein
MWTAAGMTASLTFREDDRKAEHVHNCTSGGICVLCACVCLLCVHVGRSDAGFAPLA